MATQIKTIKQKIGSVKNIKKITQTMEMVAVAKMKKTIKKSFSSRVYARYALEILVTLAKIRKVRHPLLEYGKGDKTLLIILASNKGLCGSYNINISKVVAKYKKQSKNDLDCIVVGKQAQKIARKNKLNIIYSFHEFIDNFDPQQISDFEKIVLYEFSKTNKYRNVVIAYTEFIRQMSYEPKIKEILPVNMKMARNIIEEIEKGRDFERFDKKDLAVYQFEPNEHEVLNEIIPNLLSALINQILLESGASEHSSRMFAMKNATDNANNLIDDLSLIYNKARQANITQEVAEIIAGAEALNNK
jgi:F-type H+-transporting ATPase subunit gamma